MKYLGIPIPEWVLRRWIHVSLKPGNFENTSLGQTFACRLKVIGKEPDGTPASVLRKVDIVNIGKSMIEEPFQCFLETKPAKLVLLLHFMGNYNEPSRQIELVSEQEGIDKKFCFEFRLSRPDWHVYEV